LIRDEPLRLRLVQQARRRVEERFSLERMAEETLAVYEDCLTKPRVVIWKLSALGDVVLATPSLRAIRRHFRRSPITLVVGRPVYEAVARCPYVDQVLVVDARRKDRAPAGIVRLARRLQRVGFDCSIDLQNSRLTHLLAWLAGIPTRIGYHRRWGWLLSRAVPLPNAAMNPVAHQHHLLSAAGFEPDGEAVELWPSELDEQRVERLFQRLGVDAAKPLVGIHPGGSDRWRTKRWDLARWAALCDRLAAGGYQVIVTGHESERTLIGEVLAAANAKPLVAVGQTSLMELACLIRRCAVFVTNDSSPLHVAAAMGTPAVALFGPTDPARHVAPSPTVRVIQHDVFCSPCYSTWCRTITHACMNRIAVEEVAKAVEELRTRSR
jgi:lipopolysaccharide heptosyltransferase II